MQNKDQLRKKYLFIRKKKYFNINSIFFSPLIKLINKNFKKNFINISGYYPSFFEIDILKLFEVHNRKKIKFLLPVVTGKNSMLFYQWKNYDILKINQFGMLEPIFLPNHIIPDVMLVPLLAYDNQNNRLGYGKGFYDRYLEKYLKQHKNILTIGVAFSFQKYHKLPVSKNDIKLDYILTEKGFF
jgi:5-formyltetrahydrofolate cyclo-ligase